MASPHFDLQNVQVFATLQASWCKLPQALILDCCVTSSCAEAALRSRITAKDR